MSNDPELPNQRKDSIQLGQDLRRKKVLTFYGEHFQDVMRVMGNWERSAESIDEGFQDQIIKSMLNKILGFTEEESAAIISNESPSLLGQSLESIERFLLEPTHYAQDGRVADFWVEIQQLAPQLVPDSNTLKLLTEKFPARFPLALLRVFAESEGERSSTLCLFDRLVRGIQYERYGMVKYEEYSDYYLFLDIGTHNQVY